MSKTTFVVICLFVAIPSAVPLILGCNDKWSLSIACLGSFGTIATLYLAYKIFVTYSSPVDIQKKRIELVDDALAFFITKRFQASLENGHTFFLFATQQRLGYLEETLKAENLNQLPVLISKDFFSFLLDFGGKLEHHYFPHDIKIILLSNIPQALIGKNDRAGKVSFTVQDADAELGIPDINGRSEISVDQFIFHMHTIRLTLIDFLNKKVPPPFRINDDKI
jgi:hypothetical protein